MVILKESSPVSTTDADGGSSTVNVKIVSRVETVGGGATETRVTYAESNRGKAFASFSGDNLFFVNSSGINSTGLGFYSASASSVKDWYDEQTLGLTNDRGPDSILEDSCTCCWYF